MTPAQKAAQTTKERRERRNNETAQLMNDQEQALRICRIIRDDETAAHADRLEAIRILREITAE